MILFIVNERSGNGRGRKAWDALERELAARGSVYEKIAAESAEAAAMKAEERIRTADVKAIVAVGGDGTVHSVLPLALKYRLPIGLIPSGSGNDTALAFGIPKDPRSALDIVLEGVTRPADLLSTNRPDGSPHYSVISVATGLDGAVAEDVNGSRYKRWCNRLGMGRLAYIIGLFRMLAVYKPQRITVTLDGVRHEFSGGWLTAVANLATYGGGLKICPEARPDDGHLHVCVVHGCTVLQMLLVFPTVLSGKHVRSRFVTMLKGKDVSIESPSPMPAYGDGEPAGYTPMRTIVTPNQLLFLTSASG